MYTITSHVTMYVQPIFKQKLGPGLNVSWGI